MNISFGGHTFLLHHSGVLFWPEKSVLIVSDMHLEKGSHFAQRGFFLPPYDSHETLERLHAVLVKLMPRRVLLLGDCFHDARGHARLPERERILLNELIRYEPVWITGNHDGDFVPEGFTAFEEYVLDGVSFRHEASGSTLPEISGHYHPKIEIVHKGASITRACFIEDGRKMILPSFGAYTGGLPITHDAFRKILLPDYRAYPLGKDKVFTL